MLQCRLPNDSFLSINQPDNHVIHTENGDESGKYLSFHLKLVFEIWEMVETSSSFQNTYSCVRLCECADVRMRSFAHWHFGACIRFNPCVFVFDGYSAARRHFAIRKLCLLFCSFRYQIFIWIPKPLGIFVPFALTISISLAQHAHPQTWTDLI